MTTPAFRPEFLQSAVQDHEILSQFIANVGKLFAEGPVADANEAIEAISLLLNKKILDHFAYEEKHIFAALTAARPDARVGGILADLESEHQVLRTKARELNEKISRQDMGKAAGTLLPELRVFIADLEEHASTEDDLFFSLLEENR